MVSVFFVFGVLIQIVLVLFGVHIVMKIYLFLRKRKKWGGDKEALRWTRCVLDPDGPQRPTEEDVKRYAWKESSGVKDIPKSQRDD